MGIMSVGSAVRLCNADTWLRVTTGPEGFPEQVMIQSGQKDLRNQLDTGRLGTGARERATCNGVASL